MRCSVTNICNELIATAKNRSIVGENVNVYAINFKEKIISDNPIQANWETVQFLCVFFAIELKVFGQANPEAPRRVNQVLVADSCRRDGLLPWSTGNLESSEEAREDLCEG